MSIWPLYLKQQLFKTSVNVSPSDGLFGANIPPIPQLSPDVAVEVIEQYLQNPVKKAREFLLGRNLTVDQLMVIHRIMQNSPVLRDFMTSNYYPRGMLVRYAGTLLAQMNDHPSYLDKIIHQRMVGPMMLEIHPTDATCIYRCRMCIWCGGTTAKKPVAHLYNGHRLLTDHQWHQVLENAWELGTRQLILSGGGECLLAPEKFTSVLGKANAMGFTTILYTNGRLLHSINSKTLEVILQSAWLRVSAHAASQECYAKLVNRPIKAEDFNKVIRGISRLKKEKLSNRSSLKIGLGIVLQSTNFDQLPGIALLGQTLGVDFLDIRVDCIGISDSLSPSERARMLEDVLAVREQSQSGQLPFSVSIADDLVILMDNHLDCALPKASRCLIPLIRPAIDPFGVVGACDSIGEPYTRSISPPEYVLGEVGNGHSFANVLEDAAKKNLSVKCQVCMPGQKSLNSLLEKIIEDAKLGITPAQQPYLFKN